MSKLNEAEVRERAKKCIRMNPSHESADLLAHLLDLLDSKDRVIERLPLDKIKTLPDEWCEKCLYSLLRFNRKTGIECIDCDEPDHPVSLDDDNFEAIADLIHWAQEAARNKEATDDKCPECGQQSGGDICEGCDAYREHTNVY
jgi:hypothetical protein